MSDNQKTRVEDAAGGLRPSLVPPEAIVSIARVIQHEQGKNQNWDNWQTVAPEDWTEALYMRLLLMIADGFDGKDPDSGLCHAEHLATNAVLLLGVLIRTGVIT